MHEQIARNNALILSGIKRKLTRINTEIGLLIQYRNQNIGFALGQIEEVLIELRYLLNYTNATFSNSSYLEFELSALRRNIRSLMRVTLTLLKKDKDLSSALPPGMEMLVQEEGYQLGELTEDLSDYLERFAEYQEIRMEMRQPLNDRLTQHRPQTESAMANGVLFVVCMVEIILIGVRKYRNNQS